MRSGDCLWRGTTGAVHGQAPNGEVGVEDSRLTKNVEAFKSGYKDEGELFSKPRMYFPNRSVCVDLLTDIRNLMFPGYFDDDSKAGESSDHLIAERLLHVERVLAGQIANALLFDDADLNPCLARVQAADLSAQFMDELPHVHALLLTDIEALFQGDPAAESRVEVLIAYPGFYATFVYRLAHVLYTLKVPMIPRILTEYAHGRTGIDTGVILGDAACGKVYFRLDDMIERHFVVAGLGTRLLRVEHVVGAALHSLHQLFGGAQATEGFYSCHYLLTWNLVIPFSIKSTI